MQNLQRPKIPPAPLFDEPSPKSSTDKDEHSEIVQQYLQKSKPEGDESLRNLLKIPSCNNVDSYFNDASKVSSHNRSVTNDTSRNMTSMNQKDDSAIPVSQDTYVTQQIFKGKMYILPVGSVNFFVRLWDE